MTSKLQRQRWERPAAVLIAIIAAAVLAACQVGGPVGEVSEDSQAVARELADPGSGVTQEIGDLGGYVLGATGMKAFGAGAFARHFSGDLANFTWNASTNAYERSRTNVDVTFANGTVHLDTLFVQARFYASADGSGTPIQPSLGASLDPAVHSIRYHREVQGTTTIPAKGMTADFAATTDILVASIDTAAGTATVSGSHTRTFDRSFDTGRTVNGSVNFTLDSMSISREPGTGALAWSGSLSWDWDATITRPDGAVVTRQRTGTASFSGTGTCTVNTEGQSSSYDVINGSPA